MRSHISIRDERAYFFYLRTVLALGWIQRRRRLFPNSKSNTKHRVYYIKLSCPLRGTAFYTERIYVPSNVWTATRATASFDYEASNKHRGFILDNKSSWNIVEMNAEFLAREELHGHRVHLSLPDEHNQNVLTLHRCGRQPQLLKIFYFPLT